MKAYELTHDLVKETARPVTYQEHLEQLLEQQIINEKWQDWVVGAGIGAMALGGLSAAYDYAKSKMPQPQASASAVVKPSTVDQLLTQSLKPLEKTLVVAASQAGLDSEELKQFMAQSNHETMNFHTLEELGSDRYISRKYDIKHNPTKARVLGNIHPGDGVRYKGRGYLQLTGRYNYSRASQDLFGDDRLVRNPDLVSRPDIAAQTSIWFWKNKVANKVGDFSNTRAATKPINPGLKGLDSRVEKYKQYSAQTEPSTKTKS